MSKILPTMCQAAPSKWVAAAARHSASFPFLSPWFAGASESAWGSMRGVLVPRWCRLSGQTHGRA